MQIYRVGAGLCDKLARHTDNSQSKPALIPPPTGRAGFWDNPFTRSQEEGWFWSDVFGDQASLVAKPAPYNLTTALLTALLRYLLHIQQHFDQLQEVGGVSSRVKHRFR